MKILPFCLLFISFFMGQSAPDRNAEPASPVSFGDPFILLHNDVYYAYGTADANGIAVYVSDDLLTWRRTENNRLALHKDDSWGDRWFWAPEVYEVDGRFYMYYSAAEHICVAPAQDVQIGQESAGSKRSGIAHHAEREAGRIGFGVS